MNNFNNLSAGFNLRLELIDQFLTLKPKVPFIEIIGDNWLTQGPHHKKLETIRKDYDVSFHFVGMNLGGTDPVNKKYLEAIQKLINKFQPFQVSDHLCFQAHNNSYHHDLLPIPFTNEGIKIVSEKLLLIQDFLKTSILIENLSYYYQFESSEFSEYDFINQVCQKTNCHILLDLNNIWVNQQNLKLSPTQFLDNLNLKNVKEIHVAGAELMNNVYVDTHGAPINNEVLLLLKKVLPNVNNIPIIYEQDNHIQNIGQFEKEVFKVNEVINGL